MNCKTLFAFSTEFETKAVQNPPALWFIPVTRFDLFCSDCKVEATLVNCIFVRAFLKILSGLITLAKSTSFARTDMKLHHQWHRTMSTVSGGRAIKARDKQEAEFYQCR